MHCRRQNQRLTWESRQVSDNEHAQKRHPLDHVRSNFHSAPWNFYFLYASYTLPITCWRAFMSYRVEHGLISTKSLAHSSEIAIFANLVSRCTKRIGIFSFGLVTKSTVFDTMMTSESPVVKMNFDRSSQILCLVAQNSNFFAVGFRKRR